ncbi:unnamed protein product [Arabidopsis thaliana]|uniref:Uncharacterized protein n=4 Tax=Arabidopsis TaxID=3701 RepID=A0A654FL14_ARATH|nr:uncharacterized protein AT4G01703 [Arabidopsis thaliana]KAG7614791.1 hypothetical protein ISN45_At04g002020 [Arabidopsis thaliana x Arabidopsis arenosa]KAG7619286.1 hypothetical protein ISN44_As04g002000 [Arabidopsis suecica]AEE82067.1 transmembrane protein [Arabidopsis thaliana]CAA0393073.1 unnamed protein product [Arabidopsis thaliana]VYS61525.1 unnamed protein product [Arabidopsis thaliana]|eukprot:NP_001118914.1 transmembrane protein [Arabidopsis thaliana]
MWLRNSYPTYGYSSAGLIVGIDRVLVFLKGQEFCRRS